MNKKVKSAFFIIFAVIIPGATVVIEALTGMCAELLFDPLHSWPMIAGVASIPLIAALGWWKANRGLSWISEDWMSFLFAWCLVISAYFCVVWGPLLVVGIIATIYFGLGFMVLASVFSFIASLIATLKYWFNSGSEKRFKWPVAGLAAATLFLCAVEGSALVTQWQLYEVAKAPPENSEALKTATNLIQSIGSIRECHRIATGQPSSPVGFLRSWTLNENSRFITNEVVAARRIFYHLTGDSPFENPPGRKIGWQLQGRFDPNAGGDEVAKTIDGLSLKSSYLSGKVETASELAYQEWTLELQNDTAFQQEGRFHALLPPGSVVSRLTLWVNGEPREAAFAAKNKVTAAYRSVVSRRMDPVLVRWTAPDRIYVQCFPVPEKGGTMKFRIGYFCPVGDKKLIAPLISDWNFEIRNQQSHTVRIHSDGGVSTSREGLEIAEHPEKGEVLMGEMNHADFSKALAIGILKNENRPPSLIWTQDPMAGEDYPPFLLRETVSDSPPPIQSEALSLVVDSSKSLAPHRAAIVKLVDEITLGSTQKLSCIIAGKWAPIPLLENKTLEEDARSTITRALSAQKFRGGSDNTPSVLAAVKALPTEKKATLLWIHGDQPIESADRVMNELEAEIKKRPLLEIHCFSVRAGTNFLLQSLSESHQLRSARRVFNLQDQVNAVLKRGSSETFRWSRFEEKSGLPNEAAEVSDILARSWAFHQSLEKHRTGKWDENDTALAARYQLVTPFSGAVVLETAQQYDEHGLKPVDPNLTPGIPSVPEPGFYFLLLIAGFGFLLLRIKRNRETATAS